MVGATSSEVLAVFAMRLHVLRVDKVDSMTDGMVCPRSPVARPLGHHVQ